MALIAKAKSVAMALNCYSQKCRTCFKTATVKSVILALNYLFLEVEQMPLCYKMFENIFIPPPPSKSVALALSWL